MDWRIECMQKVATYEPLNDVEYADLVRRLQIIDGRLASRGLPQFLVAMVTAFTKHDEAGRICCKTIGLRNHAERLDQDPYQALIESVASMTPVYGSSNGNVKRSIALLESVASRFLSSTKGCYL